jgi:hypothetical protein
MAIEERDHAVVQKIGRGNRRLAIVELGEGDLGVADDGKINAPQFCVWVDGTSFCR